MLGFAPTQCTHGRRCRRAGARCPVAHAAAGGRRIGAATAARAALRASALRRRAPSTGRQPSPRRDAFRPVANRRAAGRECAVERPAFARAVRPRSTRCDGRASPRGNEPPFQRRPLMRRRGTPFPCYRRSGRPARASPAAPPHRQMRRRAGGEPRRSCPGRCGRMRNKRKRRARTGVDLSQAPRRARREPDRNGGSPIRRPS